MKTVEMETVSNSLAVQWSRRLLWALEGKPYQQDSAPDKRKLLVLINPFGGAGAAVKNWEIARPMLENSHIEMTIKHTEYQNHAYEIVNGNLQPGQFDGIVTVSGDGLIHEVVNALLNREDWKKFKETVAIGCIPAGTGNGLVKSLLSHTNERYSVLDAVFKIAKGQKVHIDLTELDCEYEKKKIYSFLSVAWAIIADVDINSEAIRSIGPPRFTVWGAWRTIFKKHYLGSLKYHGRIIQNRNEVDSKKTMGKDEESKVSLLNHSEEDMINQDFIHFMACNTPFVAIDKEMSPLAKINDGQNDITTMTFRNGSTYKLASFLIDMEKGNFFNQDGTVRNQELGIDYIKCDEWSLFPTVKGPKTLDEAVDSGDNSKGKIPSMAQQSSNEPEIQYDNDAILVIDGERYKAQNVKAKVLKQ